MKKFYFNFLLIFVFGFLFFTNTVSAATAVNLHARIPNGGPWIDNIAHVSSINVPYGGSLDIGLTVIGQAYQSCESVVTPGNTHLGNFIDWLNDQIRTQGSLFQASRQIHNITQNYTWVVTCDGITSQPLNIIVGAAPAPTVSLTANPNSVPYGGSTFLSWSSTNATSCTASNGWTGNKSPNGGQSISNLTSTTTFTLTCTGPGGSGSASTTVTVGSQAQIPTVSLTADPASVNSGGATTLTWVTNNATSCNASGGWSGAKNASGGSQVIFNLTQNTTFTLTCTGPGGSGNASVTVTVIAQKPVINFIANPSQVLSGGSSTLSWSVNGATSCTASGGWTGNKNAVSGSQVISNITSTTTFTLSCSGAGGTSVASVVVSIGNLPTVNLSATPENVNYGGGTQLSWSTSGATTCSASGDWTGNKSPNGGSQLIGNLTSNKTFTLTCTNQFGQGQDTVEVTVNPQAPIVNLSANPRQIGVGGSTSLIWVAENATTCTAGGGWTGEKTPAGGAEVISNLNQTTTFTLACTGPGGNGNASVVVSVNPVPVISLTANPQNVNYGGGSQLTWTVSNAVSCSASGGWTGNKSPTGGSQLIPNITQTTVYTLNCFGIGGSTSVSETISVNPQAPVVNLSASPISVQNGGSTTLSWTTQNATTCSASDGWTGNKALSGTETINNITVNTVFTLTCTGPGGEAENFVNVSVLGKPIVSLSASPTSVFPGGSTTLTWTSTNATSCNASSNPVGLWQGNKNLSGSQVVENIPGATTFTLTCTGPGGESISYANVSQIEERITFRNTRVINGKTVLSWTLKNVKNCKASTRNPESGLNWEGDIPDEPTTGQRANVIVTAPDTDIQEKKNEYILNCNGTYSGEEVSVSLFLDVNDPASSGTKIPKYNEN